MRLADFEFDLPADRIAQRPADRRDASRLLVLDRTSGRVRHGRFSDLPEHLRAGDLLILNDTKVRPWRLLGRKPTGGRVEILLNRPLADGTWEAFVKGRREGTVYLEDGPRAEVLPGGGRGLRRIRFSSDPAQYARLHGRMPLPPYIKRPPDEADAARYQTVYARQPGAIAAPTAGLHFTRPLLERLRRKGVALQTLTLHVGPGTFLPIRTDRVRDHQMAREDYDIPAETAEAVAAARAEGRRILGVGTTVTRTLEGACGPGGVRAGTGATDIFIYPGFRFRVVDALLTNFHLPASTPLLLVAALAGRDQVLLAYRQALARGYRFFSYGDAMLVL